MEFPAFFVTGTDTGVGKSLVSATLLHALRLRGGRAVGMKPVASGCVATTDGLRNDDALQLMAASGLMPAYADVNPFAFPAPLAPELAGADVGVTVTLPPIQAAFERLRAQADTVVVEGVGGWAAPLSATLDQAELVRALDLPVVLVVGLRLGCINHARLTARAISADGVRLIGWVGSAIDPDMERCEDNLGLLRQRLPAPCWGWLPHRRHPDPAALAFHLDG